MRWSPSAWSDSLRAPRSPARLSPRRRSCGSRSPDPDCGGRRHLPASGVPPCAPSASSRAGSVGSPGRTARCRSELARYRASGVASMSESRGGVRCDERTARTLRAAGVASLRVVVRSVPALPRARAVHPRAGAAGTRAGPDPFGLAPVERADVALVSTAWYQWLATRHPDASTRSFAGWNAASGRSWGSRATTSCSSTAPGRACSGWRVCQGNRAVSRPGALQLRGRAAVPGALWTERIRPRGARYAPRELEKLRMSIPCFLWMAPGARRRLRTRREEQTRSERLARDVAEGLLAPAARGGGLAARVRTRCTASAASPTSSVWRPCA